MQKITEHDVKLLAAEIKAAGRMTIGNRRLLDDALRAVLLGDQQGAALRLRMASES